MPELHQQIHRLQYDLDTNSSKVRGFRETTSTVRWKTPIIQSTVGSFLGQLKIAELEINSQQHKGGNDDDG